MIVFHQHTKVARRTATALLAAAALVLVGAGPARAEPNVLRVNLSSTDVDYVDPALSYYGPSWQILEASCAMLLNYPDAPAPEGSRLQPEVAASMPAVSADGKTYTFTIRDGLTFAPPSTQQVTAAAVKFTIERTLNPAMHSPALPFASDIVGAAEYARGDASSISGVVADGNQLRITLTRAAPDILARLAMPFFCVVPTTTPIVASGVSAFSSAAPYYVYSRTPGSEVVLKRNANYQGSRPHFFDEIRYAVNTSPEPSVAAIKAGTVDYDAGGIPPSAGDELWTSYGPDSAAAAAGKQQYFVNPTLSTRYFALNTSRDVFDDVRLRQAVNFALDRPALIAARGSHAGRPTDQMLPPGMAGFRNDSIYPLDGPDLARAQQLYAAAGGAGRPIVLYTSSSPLGLATAEILRKNLQAVGFTVTVASFTTGVMYQKCGTRTEPFDICNVGWVADYADPFDFINVLFDGTSIRDTNNNDYSYFNDPQFNQKMANAAQLSGEERYRVYGDLDVELVRDAAPAAPWVNDNARDFFASRIGCHVFQPIYGIDLAALCLRPEISITDATAPEGDSGTTVATFVVSLGSAHDQPVTVSYATADGSAIAGADYVPVSGAVTFNAGETRKLITVEVVSDTTLEPDETFSLRLTATNAGTITRAAATGTIRNDDAAAPPPTSPPPPPPSVECIVPNVKGRPLPAAKRVLVREHCSLGRVSRAYSRRVRKGRVISEKPAPGTHLRNGGRVNVVVSRGRRR